MMDTPPQASESQKQGIREEKLIANFTFGQNSETGWEFSGDPPTFEALPRNYKQEVEWLEEDIARLKEDMRSDRIHYLVLIGVLVVTWAATLTLMAHAPIGG